MGNAAFLDESGESASDIVSLIPDHGGLCTAPESATPCEMLDCRVNSCSETIGLSAGWGENAAVPNFTDDGFPNGMEDGSSGFAFASEKPLTVVGLSKLKEFLPTGSKEKIGLAASLVLVLTEVPAVGSGLLFTFDGKDCSSGTSPESSGMNSESALEMAKVSICDTLLIKSRR